ncbi:MAG: hypothetical protein P8L91_05415, partial [Candidatus Marinimicrobia bacterium]|nr:hypothetical protein [Candidatus Neomarinimicrobiota bacterium]
LGVLIAGTVVGGIFISMIPSILVASSHFQINEQKKIKEKPGLLEGILIGIGISGVFMMTDTLQPSLSPEWPNLLSGASSVPFLSILSTLSGFLISSGFTIFIVLFISDKTKLWTVKKGLFTMLFILFGLIVIGSNNITGIGGWILSGIIIGILFRWVYISTLRYNPELTIYIISSLTIINLISEIITPAFPGAALGSLLTITAIIALNYCWVQISAKN